MFMLVFVKLARFGLTLLFVDLAILGLANLNYVMQTWFFPRNLVLYIWLFASALVLLPKGL